MLNICNILLYITYAKHVAKIKYINTWVMSIKISYEKISNSDVDSFTFQPCNPGILSV